jgi:Flp pilus assembly protein TadG
VRPAPNDSGSLTVFMACLAFALFVLIGLVVDGGRALAARETADNVAQEAARTGSSQLWTDRLRWDQVSTYPPAALAAAEQYVDDRGLTGTASVVDGTVKVTVEGSVQTAILGLIGIHSIPVEATAEATDVHGVTRND